MSYKTNKLMVDIDHKLLKMSFKARFRFVSKQKLKEKTATKRIYNKTLPHQSKSPNMFNNDKL